MSTTLARTDGRLEFRLFRAESRENEWYVLEGEQEGFEVPPESPCEDLKPAISELPSGVYKLVVCLLGKEGRFNGWTLSTIGEIATIEDPVDRHSVFCFTIYRSRPLIKISETSATKQPTRPSNDKSAGGPADKAVNRPTGTGGFGSTAGASLFARPASHFLSGKTSGNVGTTIPASSGLFGGIDRSSTHSKLTDSSQFATHNSFAFEKSKAPTTFPSATPTSRAVDPFTSTSGSIFGTNNPPHKA